MKSLFQCTIHVVLNHFKSIIDISCIFSFYIGSYFWLAMSNATSCAEFGFENVNGASNNKKKLDKDHNVERPSVWTVKKLNEVYF
jgi:hypothetical protein